MPVFTLRRGIVAGGCGFIGTGSVRNACLEHIEAEAAILDKPIRAGGPGNRGHECQSQYSLSERPLQ